MEIRKSIYPINMSTAKQITVTCEYEGKEMLLFDPTDYTDERIRKVMEGKTCRTCGNRLRHQYSKSTFYCAAIPSRRTICGLLKVKANQPACIRYTTKQPEQ